MNRINSRRVLLGGAVAGIIINIGEVVLNGIILREHIEADMQRMHITPPGNGFAALAIALTFVFAVIAIFVYAMARARFGAGPKTAVLVALLLWFCVYAYSGTINMLLINVPPKLVAMVLAWGLVEYPLGILAGAALYKEP
ncbi:MAG TPA: hypothetical protein VE969_06375 [Pyrinomonadaceae bacterium]|nr:hypothetical protein [Pyrinomonadaceae bacterium]